MTKMRSLILISTACGMLTTIVPNAHADWNGHRGYGGGYHHNSGRAVLGDVLLTLGAAAVVGSIVAPPRPVYSQPQPLYPQQYYPQYYNMPVDPHIVYEEYPTYYGQQPSYYMHGRAYFAPLPQSIR